MSNEKAVVKKDKEELTGIRALITSDAYKKQFATALPRHLKPDRFIRIALTALTKNPRLLDCTPASLMGCLLDLSQLGIEPDGRKAHLIPFKDNRNNTVICTLIVDYKGLVDLARRSGEISDIHADVVCKKDEFNYSFGSEGKLVHKPALKERGEPIAAYSFVKLKDGSVSYEVMNIEEIEAIHGRSKAKDNGPWKTDWNEMAKKTVFRRHSKWLPVASEIFQLVNEKDYDAPIDIKAEEVPTGKPAVEMPKPIKETEDSQYKAMLDEFESMKEKLGKETYYEIIGGAGYEHANQISKIDEGKKILKEMQSFLDKKAKDGKK